MDLVGRNPYATVGKQHRRIQYSASAQSDQRLCNSFSDIITIFAACKMSIIKLVSVAEQTVSALPHRIGGNPETLDWRQMAIGNTVYNNFSSAFVDCQECFRLPPIRSAYIVAKPEHRFLRDVTELA